MTKTDAGYERTANPAMAPSSFNVGKSRGRRGRGRGRGQGEGEVDGNDLENGTDTRRNGTNCHLACENVCG